MTTASETTVSVVIPVFNGDRFLAECLESVLAQKHRPLELIVVDDGSTDASVAVARRYPAVSILEQDHAGVATARNAGIEAASGRFIAFVDQDDRWTPDKLEVQLAHLLDRGDLAFTLAHLRVFLEPGMPPPPWLQLGALQRPLPGYVTGTLLARREVFREFGAFDPSCADACDADWFLRARDTGVPFEMLPAVLLEKRTHGANTSAQIDHCQRTLFEAVRRSVVRRRHGDRAES